MRSSQYVEIIDGTGFLNMDNVLKQDVLKEIAPNGVIHFAINFGNPILAQSIEGTPAGISVALAKALAAELGVDFKLNTFDAAGKVFSSLPESIWQIAFLAIEPVRTEQLSFTSPYVHLDGTYLVLQDAYFQSVNDLDQAGIQIAVGKGAAYDLFLSRTLENAILKRSETSSFAVADFIKYKFDAAAGIESYLHSFSLQNPKYRVLNDDFTQIRQAIATPKKNVKTAIYLEDFLSRKKSEGFIVQALIESNQSPTLAAP